MSFFRRIFLHGLLALAVFQFTARAGEPSAASPWNRIVVIGASASAGFVLEEPLGGTNTTNCKLRFYLDAAIATPHPPLRDYSTALMFLNPDTFSQQQIAAVVAAKPTLVIAVDFLFWSCYGDGYSDAGRLRHFDEGLKLLEKIPCPLVVGDIPDASSATNTGIISADQVADAAVRAEANARLKKWAASRPQVAVVPLAKFMSDISGNKAVTIHGLTFPAGKTRMFIQDDRLHPTPPGAALLALGILDALVTKDHNFPVHDIRWNPRQVYQLGYQSAQNTYKTP
jgi:hypothetical protein